MLAMPPSSTADIRAQVISHLMRRVLHDVNNSLTAIGLAAELALRKQGEDATAAALERAVSVSQAQRRHLDAAVLVLSRPATDEPPAAVPLGPLVSELAVLCSLAAGHGITVAGPTVQTSVMVRAADLVPLIVACLLDAVVTEGDLTVRLASDPDAGHVMRMTLSGSGLGHGNLFDADALPVPGLEALAASAGCHLIWQDHGGIKGIQFSL